MDLKQLEYFTAIVEAGSISAAARKLHISQPPLSARMKQLEEELKTPLLERGARQVTLTDAGLLLYRRAQSILALAWSTAQEVEDFALGEAGTLRLGVISSSSAAILEGRLQAFHNSYPHIRFQLHEGNTFELLEMLERNIIEMAVIRAPFGKEGLVCRYLDPEPLAAAAAPGWLPAGDGALTIEDLDGLPLIYYRRFEALIIRAFAKYGRKPAAVCVNDDARTTLLWAKAGMGVALLPQSAAKLLGKDSGIEVRRLQEEDLVTRVCAVVREGALLSVAAKGFFDCFSDDRLSS